MVTPVPAYATIDETNKQIVFAPALIGDAIGVITYTLVAISADGKHDTFDFTHEVTTNPMTVIVTEPEVSVFNLGPPYFTLTN